MALIDSHVHFFPEKLFNALWRWFDTHGWKVKYQIQAEEVLARLKESGVTRMVALNFSHKPGMSAALNRWTYEFTKQHPEIIPFGAIHPDDEDVVSELKRCFEVYGFYGIKFHCHVTGISPDDARMEPIYETLQNYGKVITIHAGRAPRTKTGYPRDPHEVTDAMRMRHVLERFPNLKVIVPHLGADEYDAFFDLMTEFPSLWMDTAMVLADYFPEVPQLEKIVQHDDRILYGSDFPNLPYDHHRERGNIAFRLPLTTQRKLFFQNAQRLFGMK